MEEIPSNEEAFSESSEEEEIIEEEEEGGQGGQVLKDNKTVDGSAKSKISKDELKVN